MRKTFLWFCLTPFLLMFTSSAVAAPKLFIGVSSDKTVYRSGDTMAFALTVLNQGGKPLQVQFASARIYDFYLYDQAGKLVWKWSDGRMFAMMLVNQKYEPKKPVTYLQTYGQNLPAGERLAPGKYNLIGALCAREKEYTTKSLAIEVK